MAGAVAGAERRGRGGEGAGLAARTLAIGSPHVAYIFTLMSHMVTHVACQRLSRCRYPRAQYNCVRQQH